MIPTFPAFAPIELTHRAPLETYLRRHPPLASEYTFTNLFGWAEAGGYALARYDEGFLVRKGEAGAYRLLQPLTPGDAARAVADGHEYLRGQGCPPLIERVGEDFLARLPREHPFTIDADPDNDDYVYAVTELRELAGPRFHDKKNLLNQFIGRYDAQYHAMTPDLARQCIDFAHAWCEERRCEQSEGLSQEHFAVVRMLTHFADLAAVGGVLIVEGAPVAFTLGEPLNDDTFVIHVEKARGDMTGAYQTINRDFLRHAAGGYRYVNREQDLGLPGLRKAKQSYNPVLMTRKWVIRG